MENEITNQETNPLKLEFEMIKKALIKNKLKAKGYSFST